MKAGYETIALKQQSNIWAKMKRYRFMYFLAAPAVIYTFIFAYVPMGGVIMAFQEYDIIRGIFGSKFIGLDNFVKIFTMPKILNAIKNTLIFSSVGLFFSTPFPIILALLFNELKNQKFKKTVQTISYLPHFLSWVSVVGMFYTFFSMDGFYNDIMKFFVGEAYQNKNILMESKYFLGVIFWSSVWKGVGWGSVIYLAAISGIDQALYEAATVDGCNRLKQVFYITLPCILPTIVIIFILATGSLVNSNFEQVYGFQNLYTQEDTEVINTLIFRQGILNGEYSLSTAFGLSQSGVSFLIVYTSNLLIKKLTGTGIW